VDQDRIEARLLDVGFKALTRWDMVLSSIAFPGEVDAGSPPEMRQNNSLEPSRFIRSGKGSKSAE
jgi:hypothetical protein